MIARRFPLLAAVLLCGALIAGCGSGNSSTAGSTSVSSTATSAPSTGTTATTGASTTSTVPTNSAGVAQYVAICKSIIKQQPSLPANVKAKVEAICNKAADGDVEGARAAAKEACVEIINASPIPSGTAKEQAVAACRKG